MTADLVSVAAVGASLVEGADVLAVGELAVRHAVLAHKYLPPPAPRVDLSPIPAVWRG